MPQNKDLFYCFKRTAVPVLLMTVSKLVSALLVLFNKVEIQYF